MELQLFRSLWTIGGDLAMALRDCTDGLFDGVESPVPLEPGERRAWLRELADAGVPLIAEITTGGSYVSDSTRTCEQHLEDFRRQAEAAAIARPLFLTVLAGRDAWTVTQCVEFFGRALAVAEELGLEASFETHRSRALFTPWRTRAILQQLPALQLTCDFSHWCCVAERLVLEEEPEILQLCADHVRHIHARVGYDQGAQVPHPAAPEHARDLAAHERWWSVLWTAQAAKGSRLCTMTPEFGPDGYLHRLPFTGEPVASLDEVNRWMAARLRERFHRHACPSGSSPALLHPS